MTALLQAEFLKLRTTRAIIGYLVALVVLSGIAAAAQAGGGELFELDNPDFQRDLFSTAVTAPLIALLVGITCVTVEWRHGMITRTFLITPRRERMLAAKELASALFGLAFGALGILVVFAVSVPVLARDDISLNLDGGLGLRLLEILLASALWGAIGAGVGALIQSQTGALVVAILWIILVEALLEAVLGLVDLDAVADVLPGRALSALDGGNDDSILSPGAGGAIGLGYVMLFAFLGAARIHRQDIT